MRNIKDNNGITLISIVITIIVTLILASVVIAFGIGENSIISHAKNASTAYKNESEKEKDILENAIESYLQENVHNVISVTGVSLDESTIEIDYSGSDKTKKLNATIEPNDATNQKLIWSSTDESVAIVDNEGKVTALSEGVSTITVITEDGNYSATCEVTVEKTQCFAKGTKITMSNGTTKNIENIKLGDNLLTFNHETGAFESQEVYIAWSCIEPDSAFTLHFDNNESISIVGKHDLFEKENLKYVTITDKDAESFIGKHFYSAVDNKYVELISVTKENEDIEYYSVYTKFNENCIANGMLSVPDDADYILNIYEFNENLTINHEQLTLDIEKYGIFEFSNDNGLTKEEYEYLNLRYLYITIGKGLITWEKIYNNYDKHFENM